MPRNKDLKRLVRARMRKTGEAYTAARAHIVFKRPPAAPAQDTVAAEPRAVPNAAVAPKDYAAIAGMSDEALKAKTGCKWERWVKALDHHGAAEMSHRDIAALVKAKYKINGWWSQNVAVGYERIKGLRARGQRRDGLYEMTKSRTFNVPVTALFEAWASPTVRRKWLDGANVKVRTASPPKSLRLGWADGSITAVGFAAKSKAKSTVSVTQVRVPSRETADRLKQYWSEQMDALGEVFSEK